MPMFFRTREGFRVFENGTTRRRGFANKRLVRAACQTGLWCGVVAASGGYAAACQRDNRRKRLETLGLDASNDTAVFNPTTTKQLRRRLLDESTIRPTSISRETIFSDEDVRRLAKYGITKQQLLFAGLHSIPIEYHTWMTKELLKKLECILRDVASKVVSDKPISDEALQKLEADVLSCFNLFASGSFCAIEEFDPRPALNEFQNKLSAVNTEKQATELTKATIAGFRESIESFLVANWEFSQYFDPFTYKEGFFGHRYAALASKTNIGTRSGTTMNAVEQHLPYLTHNELNRGLTSLRTRGFVVFRGALTKEDISALLEKTHAKGRYKSLEVADSVKRSDGNVHALHPFRGRRHLVFRGTSFDSQLTPFQRIWMPLVYGHLPTEHFNSDRAIDLLASQQGQVLDAKATAKKDVKTMPIPGTPENPTERLYVSEIQLMLADSMSTPEIWHRNNTRPGLSVLVPLADVHEERPTNGVFQVFPGTHLLKLGPRSSENLRNYIPKKDWKGFQKQLSESEGPLAIDLKKGDILVHDARILVKGLYNHSWNTVPILIYRYDYEACPPPGQHYLFTMFHNRFGQMLEWVGKYYTHVCSREWFFWL